MSKKKTEENYAPHVIDIYLQPTDQTKRRVVMMNNPAYGCALTAEVASWPGDAMGGPRWTSDGVDQGFYLAKTAIRISLGLAQAELP